MLSVPCFQMLRAAGRGVQGGVTNLWSKPIAPWFRSMHWPNYGGGNGGSGAERATLVLSCFWWEVPFFSGPPT